MNIRPIIIVALMCVAVLGSGCKSFTRSLRRLPNQNPSEAAMRSSQNEFSDPPTPSTYTRTTWKPQYKSWEEIRSAFNVTEGTDLKKPGKIYIKDHYLLVNEISQGIHIIDNKNPRKPVNLAFINIPGNVDMAVKDNYLFADSYTDLIVIDISDVSHAKLIRRTPSVFPYPLDPSRRAPVDTTKGIVVGWDMETTTYTATRPTYSTDTRLTESSPLSVSSNIGIPMSAPAPSGAFASTQSTSQSTAGTGGSMARFTVYKDFLYVVTSSTLQLIYIKDPLNPANFSRVPVGRNIETIFPYKDKLFIGSQTGMFIYDLTSPWMPVMSSQLQHSRSCDPVVCNDKYAYVTLRSGTPCGGQLNQLDIVDISNIRSPKLIKSYPMQNPYGLGIDGNTLLVCDGSSGLKAFDVTKPDELQLLAFVPNINTYDVIPVNGRAIMVGTDGVYQYDYTNPSNITQLSRIPIVTSP